MKRRIAGLCAVLFALLGTSCDLSENPEPARFISILAQDSLLAYDTVLVIAMAAGADSILDTLWNAPLERIDQLGRLPAGHYHGGAVDVLILGMKDGWAAFSLKAEYRGGPRPRLESSPPWDTIPPRLILKGPDSAGSREGQALPDTGAECLDEHPGAPRITVTGTVDPSRAGLYVLQYACRDRAGNVSRRFQSFRISRWPDTLEPELKHALDSVVTLQPGSRLDESGIACMDDREIGLSPVRAGSFENDAPGEYRLAYHCADSSGNRSADWILTVRVLPWPDRVPPRIDLANRDTLIIYDREPFSDPGASCLDDRDGSLPLSVSGTADILARGQYTISYVCADSAGNSAEKERVVRVVRAPDSAKPAITLIGPDSPAIVRGEAYADAGAVCFDDRDGNLPVTVMGAVDPAREGTYPLSYACADSSGNRADTVVRRVTVALPSDTVKPMIALRGPDSVPVVAPAYFDDPGADCYDDVDGPLPAVFSGFDPPAGLQDGFYRARYACTDKSGNVAEGYRIVKAGMYARNIMVTQDASIDTSIDTASEKYNMGYNGMLAMSMASGDRYASLFQFDLSKVEKAGLKSAKIRFVTWARGNRLNWSGKAQDYTLKIWGLQRAWVEGTGNWFYHFGDWQNHGEGWFIDYFLPTWVLNNSSNPALKIGVKGADRDLVRRENLALIATQTINTRFDASYAATMSMAPPRDLRVLEVDVTEYVRSADPSRDFGFMVTAEGAPDRIGVLSREVNDGQYATRLMLSY